MSGGDAGIKLNIPSGLKNGTFEVVDEASSLAGKHWEYINNTLHEHGVDEETLRIIGYHYRTAFIHGYKHGVESKTVDDERCAWTPCMPMGVIEKVLPDKAMSDE